MLILALAPIIINVYLIFCLLYLFSVTAEGPKMLLHGLR